MATKKKTKGSTKKRARTAAQDRGPTPDKRREKVAAEVPLNASGASGGEPSAGEGHLSFPIVALGASAGGLAALDEFFTAMPADSGMAFVVIIHQHRSGPSLFAELLQRRTMMTVREVASPTPAEPNHVYTVRPGDLLSIVHGVLRPTKLEASSTIPRPVDYFFRSLAQDRGQRAIGIVLSGTGSDGTLGLKEIKAQLGMVLAQDQATAQYAGMPNSAAATELVDHVLPASDMPKRLLAYQAALTPTKRAPPVADASESEALQQVFLLIRDRTGHDFSLYKVNTMRRRIERRMNVHHIASEAKYLKYLQANPGEIDVLFKELLIGVTSFVRDPEVWTALSRHLRRALAEKPRDYVFRAWLAGCSTGEEAYSLAIILRELMESLNRPFVVQIFATDLDRESIDLARIGEYPAGIASDVSASRLARFVVSDGETFRVRQEIREMVVFAPQNVLVDPPFTKLDLLVCRNLLIYLEPALQQKLIPLFHYALRKDGVLLLGASESISAFGDLFRTLDKKYKLFERREVPVGTYTTEFGHHRATGAPPLLPAGRPHRGPATGDLGLGILAERVLLRELVPPTILVHERGEVVHIHGRTGTFLEPPPGLQVAPNIFNMVREGLQVSVSAAIRQALQADREVVHRGVEIRTKGETVSVDLRVRRLTDPEPLRGLLRISFVNPTVVSADERAIEVAKPDRTVELERELQYAKETHQSTLEQLETANEELKSTNEEMQSTNEELQSTNEELETSKEEMQSLNEELQTLNAELQDKVEELSRMNNDMKNLLNATNIATIFLDNDLHIKRYTEQAKRVIRLIPTDIGRPIADLVSTLRYDRLVDDAREVLRTLAYREAEVQGEGDAWYLMRILPYRTVANVIDGLVLTFVDITVVRALQTRQRRLLEALTGSPTRAFGQDRNLRYAWATGEVFGRRPQELQGKTDAELFGEGAAKEMIALKRAAMKTATPKRGRVSVALDGRTFVYELYAEPTRAGGSDVDGIVCVATEVTSHHGRSDGAGES